MNKIKNALVSKTVLFAIAQAVVGIAVMVLTEADMAGGALMLKSVADIVLRFMTTRPIEEKSTLM